MNPNVFTNHLNGFHLNDSRFMHHSVPSPATAVAKEQQFA